MDTKERKIYTLKASIIIGFIVHLFFIVNGLQNTDSMWGTYRSDADSSSMGRFLLKNISGLSGWFDLQYLSSILSIVYMAVAVMFIVELLDFKKKSTILMFILLYTAFPSASGILTYSFLSDAYFLATLLAICSLYLLKVSNSKGYIIIFLSSVLVYISLGVYQSNLSYLITLYLLFLVKDCIHNDFDKRIYKQGLISICLGFLAYVIHYKIYEKNNILTSYQGISEAGDISFSSLITSLEKIISSFTLYFFNNFQFQNLFEILNVLYIVILISLIIFNRITKKFDIKQILIICIAIIIMPFTIFMMYFISPNIDYHNLMFHHMVFIFGIGLIIIENTQFQKPKMDKHMKTILFGLLGVMAFNFIIITNIYYEKLDSINRQINALGIQVVYEIRHLEGYNEDLPIVLIGDPANTLPENELYDFKTPQFSPGTSSTLINNSSKFSTYLNHFLGVRNKIAKNELEIIEHNQLVIDEMSVWPYKNSIKIVDNAIIVKF